jgi:hypothetical protein
MNDSKNKSRTWTVDELLKAQPALDRLVARQASSFATDPALAFELAAIYRKVEPEATVAHQQRLALMRECGAKEANNTLIFDDLAKQEKYHQRYEAELGQLRRKLNVEPMDWERFKAAGVELRVADLAFLDGLVFEMKGNGNDHQG